MIRWSRFRSGYVVLLLLLTLLVLAFLAPMSIVFIGTGEGGVLWRRFGGGTVFAPALGEGVHFILPWNNLTIYDLRLQMWQNRLEALTSDGLSVFVDVSSRYRLSPDNLAYLHQSIGPDYVAKVIEPQIGAAVRQLLADYPTQSLLGSARNEIQRDIFRDLTDRTRLNVMGPLDPFTGSDANKFAAGAPTSDNGNAAVRGRVNTGANTLNRPLILLQDLLISRIVIPAPLSAAIEAKLEQSQNAQSYEYRLSAERFESERKMVEAEGIRRFQDVVAQTITPAYLTLRGIQATLELAKSNNSKLIIVGGSNGLPLILNTGDSARLPTTEPFAIPAAPSPAALPSIGGPAAQTTPP
jgi:prohibitin 2